LAYQGLSKETTELDIEKYRRFKDIFSETDFIRFCRCLLKQLP
jgi:hypothetical protein